MVVDLSIVMIEDLLQVLADKDKVHTTEAQLGDAQEHVNDSPCCGRKCSKPGAAGSGKASLSHI